MRRLLVIGAVFAAVSVPVSAATGDPQASSAGFRSCSPPKDTFFTSIKVKGAGCAKARFVLTHSECLNATCSKFGTGSWTCRVKGGIAFRTTRCKNGVKRIVATASGD
jgi:hypothetical protein